MDSTKTPQQSPEESLTFIIKIKGVNRNVFFAKMIILLGLSLLLGYSVAQVNSRKYERGRELTQEKYLKGFGEYKGELLEAKRGDDPLFSTFITLIVLTILIFSYESTALIIGFLIGKVIRR